MSLSPTFAAVPRLHVAKQDALLGVVGVALVVYLIFKKYEPIYIWQHFWLLAVPPFVLASLLLVDHYSAPGAVLAAYGIYTSTIILTTLLYRVSPWHPLADTPGPLLHRLSKLTLAVASSGGKQYLHLQRLHDRYGDIVRIGPNEVSLRNADAIVPIMGPNGLPKGPHWAARNMTDSAKQLVCLTDVREHARRRRPWSRAFSVSALKGYEDIVSRRMAQFVELLERQPGPVNLGKAVGWFTYDTMSDMAFGGGSEQMRDGDQDSIWHIMEKGLAASQFMSHCQWLGMYLRHIPMAARLMKMLLDFGEERAIHRIHHGSLARDLFHYLNNEDGAEKSAPPLAQVAIDGALAIVAGADTTSCVITLALHCILTHPEVYARLQDEVDSFFPPGENVYDTSKHAKMPYMDAVINETMRLFPPLPSGSQRAATKESGGRVAGPYYIPPGTTVTVNAYAVQRDPRNFSPAPDTFWPERWLVAAGAQAHEFPKGERFVHNASAFLPFSFGPANCVGRQLGMMETRMALALVLHHFTLTLAPGWDPADYIRGINEWLVMTKPYFPVIVEKRPRRSA